MWSCASFDRKRLSFRDLIPNSEIFCSSDLAMLARPKLRGLLGCIQWVTLCWISPRLLFPVISVNAVPRTSDFAFSRISRSDVADALLPIAEFGFDPEFQHSRCMIHEKAWLLENLRS